MASNGKVALVTGAAGGIGAEVARRMAGEGYRVVLTDLDEAGRGTASEIGSSATFMVHDVTTEEGWRAATDHALEAHGGLSAVVNCAGYIAERTPMIDTPLELWRRYMAINSDGAFLACKYGIRAMMDRGGGSIVNFSSGLAELLVPDVAAYCVSKAAVVTTTKLGALAGAAHGVRVNCLLPGAVDTPMMFRNMKPGETREAVLERVGRNHPIGRVGTTTDMSEAVLFLCSERSSFITGAALPVDGGQTL